MNLLQEGGPLFMYVLLLLLFASIFVFTKHMVKKENAMKTIKLLSSIGLFALIWGFLGQIIGLIGAFDAIQSVGTVAPDIIASGLKRALLSTGFGAVVFLFARLFIIIITLKHDFK